jgi:hypothetical protein
MAEPRTETTQPTWREVALVFPSVVQEYVQVNGPLPEGPVTPEAWDAFRAWCSSSPAGSAS